MAKKENFKEMADDELKKKLDELVKGLFNLRFRKVTDVVENPAQFKKDRRNIARIKTVLRERELKAKVQAKAKVKVEAGKK
ncbi:MAG: 50S ribosomal protein L29 [Planctomycetaceae bacterium]|nr:50S ribosomal protein L29 [Planctomycetaceae bacterium]